MQQQAQLAPGWMAEIDRGPNWLFIRLHGSSGDLAKLAEAVWTLMQQEFASRLVLELDQLDCLASQMIGQLLSLRQKIEDGGGLLRVCGMSQQNQNVLRIAKLGGILPQYRTRREAVMGQTVTD